MNIREFISLLVDQYDCSDFHALNIEEWLTENNFHDNQLDDLALFINREFNFKEIKTAHVIKIWTGHFPHYSTGRVVENKTKYDHILENNEKVVSEWNLYSVKKIIAIMNNIRKKRPYEWTATDREFIGTFDWLHHEYQILMDNKFNGDEIKEHLERARVAHKNNEPFVSADTIVRTQKEFNVKK